MRKPRPEAVLANLDPEVRAELVDKLISSPPMSYSEAQQWLADEHGVRTSTGALSRFYATNCFDLRIERTQEFAAQVVSKLQGVDPAMQRDSICKAVAARVQESALSGDISLDDALRIGAAMLEREKHELRAQETELKRAQLELRVRQYEDKIREAQFILERSKKSGAITPETFEELERKLKLL